MGATDTTIDETGFHLAVGPNGETGLSGWLAKMQAAFQARYGSAVDVSPDSPDGQWLGFLAQGFTDFEQMAEAVYNGRSPAGAVGAGLSRLVQLNGLARDPGAFSAAPVVLGGSPGAVVPAGAQIGSLSDPTVPAFVTAAPYTIGGGGTVTGVAQCTERGAVRVAAGDLAVIGTVTPGWTSVSNTADATPGAPMETDPQLRARRSAAVAVPRSSMLDRLFAALAALPGMPPGGAAVYENPTGAPDLSGKSFPPHSIHAIISPLATAAAADIGNAIWTNATMGATKVGAQTYTVTDVTGNPQVQRWDLAASLPVYVTVRLSVAAPDPVTVAALQSALWDYGTKAAAIGKDIPWADLFTPINDLGVTGAPGLPSVTGVFVGTAPSPSTQADLVVPYNALPSFGLSPTAQIQVVGS